MKTLKILLFTLILPLNLFAQLTGKVTNTKGEPLPFANVYIENTTRGTSANTEGVYSLDLKNGAYRIVFQYIGYKQKIESVTIQGKTEVNIQLETSDIELSEFTVKANAEDPAYPIIRKAIEMRKVYRDQVKASASFFSSLLSFFSSLPSFFSSLLSFFSSLPSFFSSLPSFFSSFPSFNNY